MAIFQFQNVGGAGTPASAASQGLNQQNQGADRIERGLNILTGIADQRLEKQEAEFESGAKANLQSVINEINQIDSVEALETARRDERFQEAALRERFGSQFGTESVTGGVQEIQSAIDTRFQDILNREQKLDTRQDMLDKNLTEQLTTQFFNEAKEKNIFNNSSKMLNDIGRFTESVGELPPEFEDKLMDSILDLDRRFSFTKQERRGFLNEANKENEDIVALERDISTMQSQLAGQSGLSPEQFTEASNNIEGIAGVRSKVLEFVDANQGVPFEGGFLRLDSLDPQFRESFAVKASNDIVEIFGTGNENITDSMISPIQRGVNLVDDVINDGFIIQGTDKANRLLAAGVISKEDFGRLNSIRVSQVRDDLESYRGSLTTSIEALNEDSQNFSGSINNHFIDQLLASGILFSEDKFSRGGEYQGDVKGTIEDGLNTPGSEIWNIYNRSRKLSLDRAALDSRVAQTAPTISRKKLRAANLVNRANTNF